MTAPPVLWRPSAERIERATLTAYTRWLEQTRGLALPDYASLWEWSTTDLEAFWASIWEYFDVAASAPYERVLGSRAMPGAVWFPGARLNYAQHALRPGADEAVAIRHASELRPLGEMTRGELREEVARLAAGLRALGVEPGDRVVAYMPNIPEAVAAFLACASIGAVWSSCSPDFGARSVIDRFAQIEPKVLIAVDGYRYGGKDFDRLDVVRELLASLPTVEHTVLLGYLDDEPSTTQPRAGNDGTTLPPRRGLAARVRAGRRSTIRSGCSTARARRGCRRRSSTATAGSCSRSEEAAPPPRPPCRRPAVLVHDDRLDDVELPRRRPHHRGVDRALRRQPRHARSRRPLGSRRTGAASPASAPAPPTSVAARKRACEPAEGRDLSRAGSVGSTGSPLSPEGFAWVYDALGERHLALLDFRRHRRLHRVRRRRADAARLPRASCRRARSARGSRRGTEDGLPLIGEVGELVITEPMPSMPLYLWGDDDGSRYRESYFDMFPGVWRHGDWIEITERGTAIINGPLRRHDQPRRRPDGHERDLPRRPRARRGRRRARARPSPPGERRAACRSSSSSREGADLDDDLVARIRRGSARTARRATFRTSSSRSPRFPARSPARCSSCPSSASCSVPQPRRRSAATRSRTRPRSTPFEEMARRPPYAPAWNGSLLASTEVERGRSDG